MSLGFAPIAALPFSASSTADIAKTVPISLKWVLDSREIKWLVTAKTSKWMLDSRDIQWVVKTRTTKWTRSSSDYKWTIK